MRIDVRRCKKCNLGFVVNKKEPSVLCSRCNKILKKGGKNHVSKGS